MRHPRKQIFPTTADIAAPSSLCGELAAAAAGVLGGFTKRNHTGAFVPRERVTDSVARATNMNVDLHEKYSSEAQSGWATFWNTSTFILFCPFWRWRSFTWCSLCITTFILLEILVNHYVFGLGLEFFLEGGRGIYIFFPLNMLDGHFLYMFNWIVLCASRTKIIVPRLSVENHLGTKKDFKNVQRSK